VAEELEVQVMETRKRVLRKKHPDTENVEGGENVEDDDMEAHARENISQSERLEPVIVSGEGESTNYTTCSNGNPS
jgi:hypothetical protein